MSDAYASAITKGKENLIKQLQGRPNKLVKPAKVPSWTKSMKLEAYLNALEVWMEMNKDVSEAMRFQDVIESLKINKEIEVLAHLEISLPHSHPYSSPSIPPMPSH